MSDADVIDRMMTAWKSARPDLDPSPLGLVGRVIVLAQHLERSVEAALEKHHLTLGQFDILATLRRTGPKGGLTPTQLLESVMRSSGGMTARLDSLCRDGLIYRKTDGARGGAAAVAGAGGGVAAERRRTPRVTSPERSGDSGRPAAVAGRSGTGHFTGGGGAILSHSTWRMMVPGLVVRR